MTRTTWNPSRNLDAPLRWRKPRLVRVNMTGSETDAQIDRIFAVMALATAHTFEVLAAAEKMQRYLTSKRPKYIADWYIDESCQWWVRSLVGDMILRSPKIAPQCKTFGDLANFELPWPLPNVHIGTTCRTQAEVDHAVPILLSMPNARPWMRIEPGERISLARWTEHGLECSSCKWTGCEDQSKQVDFHDEPGGWACPECGEPCAHTPIDETIDAAPSFLIELSGQTGPDALPLHPDWARLIRDECKAASVDFRFVSWGQWVPYDDDHWPASFARDDVRDCDHTKFIGDVEVYPAGPRRSGRILDGVTHDGGVF
jgi:hypothetical protein